VTDFPDDETATAVVLQTAVGGNVRTTTLKAFDAEQMSAIIRRTGSGHRWQTLTPGARIFAGTTGMARAGSPTGVTALTVHRPQGQGCRWNSPASRYGPLL
jgi:hypothetical protein